MLELGPEPRSLTGHDVDLDKENDLIHSRANPMEFQVEMSRLNLKRVRLVWPRVALNMK